MRRIPRHCLLWAIALALIAITAGAEDDYYEGDTLSSEECRAKTHAQKFEAPASLSPTAPALNIIFGGGTDDMEDDHDNDNRGLEEVRA